MYSFIVIIRGADLIRKSLQTLRRENLGMLSQKFYIESQWCTKHQFIKYPPMFRVCFILWFPYHTRLFSDSVSVSTETDNVTMTFSKFVILNWLSWLLNNEIMSYKLQYTLCSQSLHWQIIHHYILTNYPYCWKTTRFVIICKWKWW